MAWLFNSTLLLNIVFINMIVLFSITEELFYWVLPFQSSLGVTQSDEIVFTCQMLCYKQLSKWNSDQ